MPEWTDQNGDPIGTYVTRVNMHASNPSVLTYSGRDIWVKTVLLSA